MLESEDRDLDYSAMEVRQRQGLPFRIELQKLHWRKGQVDSAVEQQCRLIERRLRRAQQLGLLVQLLRDKAKQYEPMTDEVDITLRQLSDKRMLYRFLFSKENFRVVERHLSALISSRLSLVPQ